MANRFWIPSGGTGTGNWDGTNTANWSTSSGGSSGASVPTSVDSVFFDANSFNGAGQAVTIVTATANCLDMNWTGATNTPTLAGAAALNVYGSLTFIAGMINTYSNTVIFRSTAIGKTITTNGIAFNGGITFSGVGGEWTLQDNLTNIGGTSTLSNGSLITNNKTMNLASFTISGGNARSLALGSSVINISNAFTATTTTNLTFSAGTSTINMTSPTVARSFDGGGLTYNNVAFTTTAIFTIIGNNTFNGLSIVAGGTLKLTSLSTQTYTTLSANGTPASKISIQSVTAGSAATLSKASGFTVIRNITLKDITVTGGATFYALGTTNVSGNTGWAFQMLIKQEKLSSSLMALYHIDSSGAMTKVSG